MLANHLFQQTTYLHLPSVRPIHKALCRENFKYCGSKSKRRSSVE